MKWGTYFDTKFAWYRDRVTEIKSFSEGTDISTKDYEIISRVELVNLELAIDQTWISELTFSGATGQFLKRLQIFSQLLTTIGIRMSFYTSSRVRGF